MLGYSKEPQNTVAGDYPDNHQLDQTKEFPYLECMTITNSKETQEIKKRKSKTLKNWQILRF